ncbi:hypothetical protein D3C73_768020 [compost metagenome]
MRQRFDHFYPFLLHPPLCRERALQLCLHFVKSAAQLAQLIVRMVADFEVKVLLFNLAGSLHQQAQRLVDVVRHHPREEQGEQDDIKEG